MAPIIRGNLMFTSMMKKLGSVALCEKMSLKIWLTDIGYLPKLKLMIDKINIPIILPVMKILLFCINANL